jgi:hypothetical protein
MRLLLALVFTISCSSTIKKDRGTIDLEQRSFHYDSIPTTYLKTDSLELVLLIKDSKEILGSSVEMSKIESGDLSKQLLMNGTRFKLIAQKTCGTNSWYLISKERPKSDQYDRPYFKRPYKGLFLSLKDSKKETIGTLKLTEYLDVQMMTPWINRINSHFRNDTTLVCQELSYTCSDVSMSCWETTTTTEWTITCDKFKLNKSEQIRVDLK